MTLFNLNNNLIIEQCNYCHYIVRMKKTELPEDLRLKRIENKIDKLQLSLDKLDSKLNDHITFIEKVYQRLKSPISNIRNIFG